MEISVGTSSKTPLFDANKANPKKYEKNIYLKYIDESQQSFDIELLSGLVSFPRLRDSARRRLFSAQSVQAPRVNSSYFYN